jgi:hypothetical protein
VTVPGDETTQAIRGLSQVEEELLDCFFIGSRIGQHLGRINRILLEQRMRESGDDPVDEDIIISLETIQATLSSARSGCGWNESDPNIGRLVKGLQELVDLGIEAPMSKVAEVLDYTNLTRELHSHQDEAVRRRQ